MKILIPFNNPEKVDDFIQAGAEEFYYGFYDPKWSSKFGKYADLNRMSGYGKDSNRLSFPEFIKTVDMIHSKGAQSFLTLNPSSYSKEELNYIEENYIPYLLDSKLDGIIASDINLIKLLKKYNLNIASSTICSIYNSDIAKAFVDLGVKRIILPRDLSLDEIESIRSELPEDIKVEVFLMRNGCVFSDGLCLGMHRNDVGATCAFFRYHYKNFINNDYSLEYRENLEKNDFIYTKQFHSEACGLCALYRLLQAGINTVKIVGRSDDPDSIVKDIELTKENILIAQQVSSEVDYLMNMKKPESNNINCSNGLHCYYPEVKFC